MALASTNWAQYGTAPPAPSPMPPASPATPRPTPQATGPSAGPAPQRTPMPTNTQANGGQGYGFTGNTMQTSLSPGDHSAMSALPSTRPNVAPPPGLQPPQQPPPAPPGEGYGPGFGEQYGKEHIGQYDQPTMLEQFAQQQMDGNNPYYDRMRQQGEDRINQQMAARGHYNSGGALSALGNFDAGLYADQFAGMGQLAGQASNLQLNRQGQGFQQASGIQGLQQQRTGQQFGEASDIAHLGAGLYGGFYGQGGQQSGDAAMAGINAGANAANLGAQGKQAGQNFIFDAIKGAFVPA